MAKTKRKTPESPLIASKPISKPITRSKAAVDPAKGSPWSVRVSKPISKPITRSKPIVDLTKGSRYLVQVSKPTSKPITISKPIVDLTKGSPYSVRKANPCDTASTSRPTLKIKFPIKCEQSISLPSTTFLCDICADEKPKDDDMFTIVGCDHSYCSECVVKYVDSKLQENVVMIPCPFLDCKGSLEPENCRSILPKQVFDRWCDALCESIIGSEKFYCPFKDCSALLIDARFENEGALECECPECHRLFCGECKVPWHSSLTCNEYQKLRKDERGNDDIKLMNLAKSEKWNRCPKCRFYVQRSMGCLFIRCRCGHGFCYNCGASTEEHFCRKCKH